MDDLISRSKALEAMWKALYEYEEKTEKQFQESDELDVSDWIMIDRMWVQNGHNLCVDVLTKLPSAQPDCTDCIWDVCNYNKAISAQPERKKGRWNGYNADNPEWLRDDGSPMFLTCSECNGTVVNNGSAHWNFCPNCGADMRGEADGTP